MGDNTNRKQSSVKKVFGKGKDWTMDKDNDDYDSNTTNGYNNSNDRKVSMLGA
jgi:hypothetical protein